MGSSQRKIQSMKVLIDTNIIIDVAIIREPFFANSDRLLACCEQGIFKGYISASTISDLFYILRKLKGRTWTIKFLKGLISFCHIATVNGTVINNALNTDLKDFEDAIQYQTAIASQLDAIVTRNPKDYKNISIAVFTPSELLKSLKQDE